MVLREECQEKRLNFDVILLIVALKIISTCFVLIAVLFPHKNKSAHGERERVDFSNPYGYDTVVPSKIIITMKLIDSMSFLFVGIFMATVCGAFVYDVNEQAQRILTARGSLPDEIGVNGMPYHELHYKKEQCGDAKCTVSTTSIFSNFNQSLPSYEWFVKASNDYGMGLVSQTRKKATAMLITAALMMCKKGDIVETGVFNGGSTALMMKYLIELDQCNPNSTFSTLSRASLTQLRRIPRRMG